MAMTFRNELGQKKTLIFFLLAVLLIVIGTFVQFKKTEKSNNNDFRVYYKTSVRLQNGDWPNIYTRNDGAFPYRYVPYTLPAFTWIAHFSEPVGRKVWVFLQSVCFALGFYFLYKSLVITESLSPLLATSLSFILTFRQFMDSLYSGQVAGFIFLSFSLGMYFYLKGKTVSDGVANSVAASLKIFPGFLLIHGLIKAPGSKKRVQFFFSGILLFIVLNALYWIWLKLMNQEHLFLELWKNWASIALASGEYFDGSTPKSQSLRAFILRTFGKTPNSETLWKILFLTGISGLVFHWIRRNAKNGLHKAYSYSLGIMAFIIFMPESLPYQLMNVAIPFAVFLSDVKLKSDKFHKLTLVCFMVFISFAATDIIGRKPSDWMQEQSFAFFVLCLLSFIMIKESKSRA